MGDLPPAECQAELWLLRDLDAERAARILSLQEHAEETPWDCSACGEQAEPQFTQCWRCGAYRA